jgi:hypothetical protein
VRRLAHDASRQSCAVPGPLPARPPGHSRPGPGAPVSTLALVQRYAGNAGAQRVLRAAAPVDLWRCGPVPCDCPAEDRLAADSQGLSVSSPWDPAEREAERVADEVMRLPEGASLAAAATARAEYRPGSPALVLRQPLGGSSEADAAAEREFGDKPAPKAQSCGSPSHCPPGFCSPYRSEELAKYYRSKNSGWLLKGISAFVDSRIAPLWREHLWGGSAPKNLSAEFGADFTGSPTTKQTTAFLSGKLQAQLTSSPPFVPRFSRRSVDLTALISGAISELGDPASVNRMNFNKPRDVPGNLAGGIGKDQSACPAGAQPSPFDDERLASGTVELSRGAGREVTATPEITYTVRDTIDLCPGDCGALLEKVATVPLSQFEATGISGDIPFTVEFPAPKGSPLTFAAPEGPELVPAPAPKPTGAP